MEDNEDQYDQAIREEATGISRSNQHFSDPPQPPKDPDEPVPFIPPEEIARGFMGDVRMHFLKLLTTEQAFQLLADLNRDLNEALAREIEEQTSKVSEAQQKLDRLSGLKYNLLNR